jgi:hypothetical protein
VRWTSNFLPIIELDALADISNNFTTEPKLPPFRLEALRTPESSHIAIESRSNFGADERKADTNVQVVEEPGILLEKVLLVVAAVVNWNKTHY